MWRGARLPDPPKYLRQCLTHKGLELPRDPGVATTNVLLPRPVLQPTNTQLTPATLLWGFSAPGSPAMAQQCQALLRGITFSRGKMSFMCIWLVKVHKIKFKMVGNLWYVCPLSQLRWLLCQPLSLPLLIFFLLYGTDKNCKDWGRWERVLLPPFQLWNSEKWFLNPDEGVCAKSLHVRYF